MRGSGTAGARCTIVGAPRKQGRSEIAVGRVPAERADDTPVAESGTFAKGSELDPLQRLARRLRARLVRPSGAAIARGSLGPVRIPDDVVLLPDGSAIAAYDGEPLLRYRSLAHLCAQHGLSEEDLIDA